MAKPVGGASAAGASGVFGASAVSASAIFRGFGTPHAADSAAAASPCSGEFNGGGGGPAFGQQQAPAFGAIPFGASSGGFGFDATKPATGFGTAAGFGAYIFGSRMRKFVIEENYTIVRTLIQIRRKKHNDPNPKKDHLGFGFLGHDFFKVLLGPMMESTKKWRRTDADIKVAVRAWANPATRAAAEITYGHISDWETSQVTNMEKLFYGYWNGGDANMKSFNDDISRWDTSNVTTMECMFYHAHAFNGDLSRWDTSKVTNRYKMFDGCPIKAKHEPPRRR